MKSLILLLTGVLLLTSVSSVHVTQPMWGFSWPSSQIPVVILKQDPTALPPGPNITVSPNPVIEDGTLTINGLGFNPRVSISVFVLDSEGNSVLGSSVTSDGNGDFNTVLPLTSLVPGFYSVKAVELYSGNSSHAISLEIIPA
jgi:hypothetical protein